MKFPARAIDHCLKSMSLDLKDLDAIAISWNPLINIAEMPMSRLTATSRHKAELLYSTPANLLSLAGEDPSYMKQTIEFEDGNFEIYYVTHHTCHAAHSFFESGFDEAVILTCDGYGENETSTVSIGRGDKIEKIATTYFPNSVGMFYGTITEFLGYRHDSDEWKVMALGAYGKPNLDLYRKLRDLFTVNDDLSIKFNTEHFQFDNMLKKGLYDGDLIDYLEMPPIAAGGEFEDRHYDLAHATQLVFEDVILELCRKISDKTQLQNICLGGGSFMNSVFNGKLAKSGIFENVYIPFAPNDGGCAIGAAYYVHHNLLGGTKDRQDRLGDPYVGPAYSDEKIEHVLELFKCKYRKLDDTEKVAAQLLVDGKILGWFQGAMEFGERALGNRSILADPRNPASKEKVNAIIKFREAFRPFAPSILAEHASEYFDLPADDHATPYMEKVFAFKQDKAALVPSVVHADGTGRLQTVSKEGNPKYHALISEFHALTGVPIVLNTSFNRNGEPIVCSPEDALNVFFGSGLDYLIMSDFLVEK